MEDLVSFEAVTATFAVPKRDLETLEKLLTEAMRMSPMHPDYVARLRVVSGLLTQVSLARFVGKAVAR